MLETTLYPPLVIIVSFGVYGLVHSLLAQPAAKDLAASLLGERAPRYYRLAYTIFASITFIPVLALPALLPDQPWYRVPTPWHYLFWAGQALSIGLLIYSLLQTGVFQFVGLPQAIGVETNDELNIGGLYRWMRHPLYTFTLTFLWLSTSMTRNMASFYLTVSLYSIIGAWFEERKLVAQFGEAYQHYQQRTPMLIPGWPKK